MVLHHFSTLSGQRTTCMAPRRKDTITPSNFSCIPHDILCMESCPSIAVTTRWRQDKECSRFSSLSIANRSSTYLQAHAGYGMERRQKGVAYLSNGIFRTTRAMKEMKAAKRCQAYTDALAPKGIPWCCAAYAVPLTMKTTQTSHMCISAFQGRLQDLVLGVQE